VTERAQARCEYRKLAQVGQEATFHVDHIIPRSASGATTLDNLALACVSCSLRKSDRQHGIDPDTVQEAPLFHPRRDRWSDHFRWDGLRISALFAVGRATIDAFQLNRPLILGIRYEESFRFRHPPPEELET
jgi:hypothetical protein